MRPAVDVIIVSHNTLGDLAACLRSLDDLTPAPFRRVTVVDNASTDGTPDALRRDFPAVDLVALDRNVGFAAANNIGFARGSSPLVLLLNPDTIVPPGAIEALAGRLDETGAAAAGPRLVDREGRPEVSFGPMLTPLAEARQLLRQRLARSSAPLARWLTGRLLSRERFVDWVTAACCLVVRERAVAAGLFDERFFMYEEDVDLCAGLRSQGGRILYTPAAEVVHLRGTSTRRTPETLRRHYDRSHQLFYEKHHPRWAAVLGWWKRRRGRSPIR